ncbi:MAG: phosphoribosylformylglycinamidine cyclo-ligase [Planctomycetota bacterium]
MASSTTQRRRPRKGLTYADAGVSIESGDAFARAIRAHLRRTHGPRVIANDGGFAGLFRLDYNESLFKQNFRDPVLVACTDGVGTKIILAREMGIYEGVGIDLVAMNVNDLVVAGAEPLLFLDYIACGKVEPAVLERVVAGVADACRDSGAALLGGETAEMPDVYEPGELDLAGFAVGVVELSRAMDATRVEPGDIVIGLESDGVHSNGFSLVRAAVEQAKLNLHRTYDDLDPDKTLGEVLLTPTHLYASPIVRILRGYRVKKVVTGMAHITGGGLADNLGRALHDGVDAVINEQAWTPPPVFPFLQKRASIEPDEMRCVFNMGIGFCLIVRPAFAAAIMRKLHRLGERAHEIGKVVKGTGTVRLQKRRRESKRRG